MGKNRTNPWPRGYHPFLGQDIDSGCIGILFEETINDFFGKITLSTILV